jgi:hypothetical protein
MRFGNRIVSSLVAGSFLDLFPIDWEKLFSSQNATILTGVQAKIGLGK